MAPTTLFHGVTFFSNDRLLRTFKMDKAFLIFSIIGLLDHALVSAQKCPKLARTSPALIKPKNCPSWSSVPKSVGSLKDNECLIGGILGVRLYFYSICRLRFLG
jgi:hypothetical protein